MMSMSSLHDDHSLGLLTGHSEALGTSLLLHAWLHHHLLLRVSWLLHTWLHHTGLLHTGLHHTGLHLLHLLLLHLLLVHLLLLLHHLLLLHLLLLHHLLLLNHLLLLHLLLLHAWLHHLLLGTASGLGTSTSWFPDTPEMDLTGLLAFESNLEPFVHATVDAESGKFEDNDTNKIIGTWILIVDLDGQIITDILDVNLESFVPGGSLTCTILDSSLEVLLTSGNFAVWVHLTESLGIAR